jgi:hypothetical protein
VKYRVHPALAHTRAILESVQDRTGKPVEEWEQVLKDAGQTTFKDIVKFLKSDHKVGRATATALFAKINDVRQDFDDDAYIAHAPTKIDKQYTGGKKWLRKKADTIFKELDSFGDDVGASPTKTLVSFYRQHVFAQVQAATQTRIDVGLALGGYKKAIPERLVDMDGKNSGDRITHVISISSLDDIDAEFREWAHKAYELDK